jgi:DNA-binding XRE family transcriptional regulator
MSEGISKERKQEKIATEKLQVEVGRRIKKIREEKGMNQTELAIKMNNRDRQVIQRLEKGKTNCSLNLLRMVAAALEVEIEELFKQ